MGSMSSKLDDIILKEEKKIEDKAYEEEDIVTYKVVVLGERGVGKTQVLNRYCHNRFKADYEPNYDPVLTNVVKKVQLPRPTIASLVFYDISDPEEIDLQNLYYQKVDAVLIVCDVNDLDSIKKAAAWRNKFFANMPVRDDSSSSSSSSSSHIVDPPEVVVELNDPNDTPMESNTTNSTTTATPDPSSALGLPEASASPATPGPPGAPGPPSPSTEATTSHSNPLDGTAAQSLDEKEKEEAIRKRAIETIPVVLLVNKYDMVQDGLWKPISLQRRLTEDPIQFPDLDLDLDLDLNVAQVRQRPPAAVSAAAAAPGGPTAPVVKAKNEGTKEAPVLGDLSELDQYLLPWEKNSPISPMVAEPKQLLAVPSQNTTQSPSNDQRGAKASAPKPEGVKHVMENEKPSWLKLAEYVTKRFRFTGYVLVSARLYDGFVHEAIQAVLRRLKVRTLWKDPTVDLLPFQPSLPYQESSRVVTTSGIAFPDLEEIVRDKTLNKEPEEPDWMMFESPDHDEYGLVTPTIKRIFEEAQQQFKRILLLDGKLEKRRSIFIRRCFKLELISSVNVTLGDCLKGINQKVGTGRDLMIIAEKDDGYFILKIPQKDVNLKRIRLEDEFINIVDAYNEKIIPLCRYIQQEMPDLRMRLDTHSQDIKRECERMRLMLTTFERPPEPEETEPIFVIIEKNRVKFGRARARINELVNSVSKLREEMKDALPHVTATASSQ